jgi:hypothetical protein
MTLKHTVSTSNYLKNNKAEDFTVSKINMTWVCKMALCVTLHRDSMGVQCVSELLQLEVEIKINVSDLHFSGIKRTVVVLFQY